MFLKLNMLRKEKERNDGGEEKKRDVQHSPEYSTPAYKYPAAEQADVQRATVKACAPPVVAMGTVRVRAPASSLN